MLVFSLKQWKHELHEYICKIKSNGAIYLY